VLVVYPIDITLNLSICCKNTPLLLIILFSLRWLSCALMMSNMFAHSVSSVSGRRCFQFRMELCFWKR
jgi:hypothetical protein